MREVSRSQITGLRRSRAFGLWGWGWRRRCHTCTGKLCAPSMQRHSMSPFYKPLLPDVRSPQNVCVCECVCMHVCAKGHIWGCLLWLLLSLGRKKEMFSFFSPKLTKDPWSTEQASWMLARLHLFSPSQPEPVSSQILPSHTPPRPGSCLWFHQHLDPRA